MRFPSTVSLTACLAASAFAAPDITLEGLTDTTLSITNSTRSVKGLLQRTVSGTDWTYGLNVDIPGIGYSSATSAAVGMRVKIPQGGTVYGYEAQLEGGSLMYDARGFYANVLSEEALAYGAYLYSSATYEDSYGVYAEGNGGYGNGYGVYAIGNTAFGDSWGIYASATSNYNTAMAGYFDGNVAISGTCSPCVISDSKLKKNVKDYEGGLGKIMALKPKSYEMKTDEVKGKMNLAKGAQIGLLAQEVEAVIPEIVHEIPVPNRQAKEKGKTARKNEKYKAVNYTELVPVLIKAVQEQQAEIAALRERLNAAGLR